MYAIMEDLEPPQQQVPNPIPNWSNALFLFEPSCLLLIALAVLTVLLAAIRGMFHDVDSRKKGIAIEDSAITIETSHAILFPVAGSFSLLMLFFFFTSIQFLLLLLLMVATATAVIFTLQPIVAAAAVKYPTLRRQVTVWRSEKAELTQVLTTGIAVGCLIAWVVTGSMFLNNVLGICLCISFISYVKLPNIKVSSHFT